MRFPLPGLKRISFTPRAVKVGEKLSQPRQRIDLGDISPRQTIYAIGDVHGCLNLLRLAEEAIQRDMELHGVRGIVVLLGDYVDRGPSSAQVLDHLTSPTKQGFTRIAVCGNHDDAFLRFLKAPENNKSWLEMGGRETLLSYGIDVRNEHAGDIGDMTHTKRAMLTSVPQNHLMFLETLPVCVRLGRYLFVHAGVRPGVPLGNQSDIDMMWIREPFISMGPQLPYTLIHGHTPSKLPTIGFNRIGIDTGAYVTGRLTVLKLEDGGQKFLLVDGKNENVRSTKFEVPAANPFGDNHSITLN